MTDPLQITYYFDPLCGWCYGASPRIDALLAREDVAIVFAPSGLFTGEGARPMDDGFAAYAWSNDERIASLTGQPFSETYRRKILGDRTRLFDSGPATLALAAVALTAGRDSEAETLKAIQHARYVDGRDITDPEVLIDILQNLNLGPAAERFAAADTALIAACTRRIDAARSEMRRLGITGVPTLVAENGGTIPAIARASDVLGGVDGLVASLKAA